MAEYQVTFTEYSFSFLNIAERKVMTHAISSQLSSILNDKFVDMKFITRFTGLTDKWFYKMIQEGDFPKPIKLGRSSRWLQSEVEAWVHERIAESRAES
jgi:prophage regulatory protein